MKVWTRIEWPDLSIKPGGAVHIPPDLGTGARKLAVRPQAAAW